MIEKKIFTFFRLPPSLMDSSSKRTGSSRGKSSKKSKGVSDYDRLISVYSKLEECETLLKSAGVDLKTLITEVPDAGTLRERVLQEYAVAATNLSAMLEHVAEWRVRSL